MGIRVLSIIATVLLAGCQNQNTVTLETQGQAEAGLTANEYDVQVTFREQGEQQSEASSKLSLKLSEFEAWSKQQGLMLTAGRHEIRPLYQYHPEQGRQPNGFEASQVMNLDGLSFSQYQQVLSQGPAFKPDTLSLSSVTAGEAQKQQVKSTLINDAFSKAKFKALSMAHAADLCDLRVSQMREQFNGLGSPRMMKMEMASNSLHQTESQETIQLNLNVSWQAELCD